MSTPGAPARVVFRSHQRRHARRKPDSGVSFCEAQEDSPALSAAPLGAPRSAVPSGESMRRSSDHPCARATPARCRSTNQESRVSGACVEGLHTMLVVRAGGSWHSSRFTVPEILSLSVRMRAQTGRSTHSEVSEQRAC